MAAPRTEHVNHGAGVLREPWTHRAADRLRGAGRRLGAAARRLRSATTKDVDLPGPRRLATLNLVSRSRLAGGPGPVVSLTTYGTRIRWSHLAIESIARGSLTPSRTGLWLDDEAAFARLPRPLRRLRRRGLEIRLSENLGPHTKYFPFIEASDSFTGPLVTADDDTIYPRFWLERLAQERLIDGESRTFSLLEGTQDVALWYVNVSQGRNDAQIAATYTAEDISRLVEAAQQTTSMD